MSVRVFSGRGTPVGCWEKEILCHTLQMWVQLALWNNADEVATLIKDRTKKFMGFIFLKEADERSYFDFFVSEFFELVWRPAEAKGILIDSVPANEASYL